MSLIARLLALAFTAVLAAPAVAAAPTPVTFTAADHVKVFATYYGTGDKSKPIVLLFHQAAGSGAEYPSIAAKLHALGFNALAVDQRSGGNLFGRANKTVMALGYSTGYRAALPDLQAALDWARANESGKIAGLMAFSPGEYLGAKHAVRDAAAKLKNVAVFVASASNRNEVAAARAILAAVPSPAKTQVVPQHAPHGASALIASANPRGYKEEWAEVERFLARFR